MCRHVDCIAFEAVAAEREQARVVVGVHAQPRSEPEWKGSRFRSGHLAAPSDGDGGGGSPMPGHVNLQNMGAGRLFFPACPGGVAIQTPAGSALQEEMVRRRTTA